MSDEKSDFEKVEKELSDKKSDHEKVEQGPSDEKLDLEKEEKDSIAVATVVTTQPSDVTTSDN